MNLIQAIFLGILQGLTEFLPVSSSGHLAVVQSLLPNFSQPGILFDVILHFATVFAVTLYFWKKILRLNLEYIKYIVVGTIPAVIIGFFFKDLIEGLFSNIKLIGIAFLITALLNYLTSKSKETGKELDAKLSLFVGVFQAIAIIPGVSRSGSTIFAGTHSGLNKKKAAEFSFLLSVPAVLGANLLEVVTHAKAANVNLSLYLISFVAAFISGYFAIGMVMKLLQAGKFKVFAFYCLTIGLAVLLFL